jgi:hypothetical protein
MNGKKSFVLYTDQKEVFDELTDEDAGKLIKHIFAYVNDENPEQKDKLLKIAFLPIKTQLKRDLIIWDEKKQQRAEAGRMGGLAKASKASNASEILANPSNAKQSLANLAVNVNGNVNVNDNVNVNGNVKRQISANALFSLEDVFIDFEKEKPLKRPYFERMSEVHSIDTKSVKEYFKKWATIKEGEPMTIGKAENSFNLYLSNNLKSNFKPPEKKETYNVFEEIWQDMQKEKEQLKQNEQ